jgi:hypothetical protein
MVVTCHEKDIVLLIHSCKDHGAVGMSDVGTLDGVAVGWGGAGLSDLESGPCLEHAPGDGRRGLG